MLTLNNKDDAVIEGYEALLLVRESQSSGGISILFKSKFNVEVFEEIHVCNSFIETCTIKLKLNNISYHIIRVYCPHSGSVEDLTTKLVTLFSKVRELSHQNVILLGNLNIKLLEHQSNKSQSLCNFMRSNCLIPVIIHHC